MAEMFRNVVRGFSLVQTTLKGRPTKGGCLAMTPYCHCERSVAIPVGVLLDDREGGGHDNDGKGSEGSLIIMKV